MDGVVLLILTRNLLQVKGDFSGRGEKGKKKWRRIRWRAMAAFINGGHQPVRCPRFRLSALAKGGSIFINAWHLDSYFKYTPSEYHEFVFNKSADEWAHRFWLPPCYRNRAPVNKRFSFFLRLRSPPPRIVLPFSWINRESCSPRPAKISRLRDLHFENWLIIPKIRNIVDTSSSWSRQGGEEDGRRKIYMRRRGEKFRLNGSRSGGDTTRMMDSRQLWRQHGIVLPTDGKHWLIAAVLV